MMFNLCFYQILIQLSLFNGFLMNFIEKTFDSSIEKVLLVDNYLYIGTIHSLHRLSSNNLQTNHQILDFNQTFHWKIFSLINKNQQILSCRTINQGICQLIDLNLNIIWNSSFPIVANDQLNSTISLILPQENLIYIGVTNTNNGYTRWQIPNICGRSLNLTNFLEIYSIKNENEQLISEDFSIRFLRRQQLTYIVQYIYSFSTENYIYFVTNQPNENDQTQIQTKIVRFCRTTNSSILKSYSEIPLNCLNSNWIIQSAQILFDSNNQMILIGHFKQINQNQGTKFCFWNIKKDIDRNFLQTYENCYSKGIGQTGLHFIKPSQTCRNFENNWSKQIKSNEENLCPWIINQQHLPFPISGQTSIDGYLFYENLFETTSSLQIYSYGSLNLLFQGLINSTFKLGIVDSLWNINWIYSNQLKTNQPILNEILFQNQTATFFLASGSKIFRWSLNEICQSKFLSSNETICRLCPTNKRCALSNNCDQCIQIVNVQPLNSSIDRIQWINITFLKLPNLNFEETFQCEFVREKQFVVRTRAIKLNVNQISCPTPSPSNFQIFENFELKVNLSIIKYPSNITLQTIGEYIFLRNLSIKIEDFHPKISSKVISIEPTIIDQSKTTIMHIVGENLFSGNFQEIFFGNFQCLNIKQITTMNLTCQLSINSIGIYNLTYLIDRKSIENTNKFVLFVKTNAIIEDIYPLTSFASGGRLITVHGQDFHCIHLRFSYKNWFHQLTINSTNSKTFQFRSPSIPYPSNEIDSLPINIQLTINFDQSFEIHYIDDLLFNLSRNLPILFYTGEQLRLQIENLTNGASIDDIEILINSQQCRINSFSSRSVTCQPPRQLINFNSSIGTIRFRIGYREHLIGYLSYENLSKSSFFSIERLIMFVSCFLTIVILLCSIYFYLKNSRKYQTRQISSNTNSYDQVYEQIPSLSSSIVCPYHQSFHLKTVSIEIQQLTKLFFSSNFKFQLNFTQSIEIFFDLLNLKSFSDSFLIELIELNNLHLFECYIYLFRSNISQLKSLPTNRQISYLKFISTILIDSKENFLELFQIFDYLLNNLIEFFDQTPTDQILNRSLNSFTSISLLNNSNFSFQSINLSINYENLFHFNLQVFDCDTIEQIKQKLVKFLNFYDKNLSIEQIDLLIPLKFDRNLNENQIPMIKNYEINSTIFCRKSFNRTNIHSNYSFHLVKSNQLIQNEKLKENFQSFENIFETFLRKLLSIQKCFSLWQNEIFIENSSNLFKFYIQLLTDLIRNLNSINILRPNCSIIQSALNSIADGIEFIFQTKDQFSSEIELLYEKQKEIFHSFEIPLYSIDNNRSNIVRDSIDNQCLFKLYQFYQTNSYSINQRISSNNWPMINQLLEQIQSDLN